MLKPCNPEGEGLWKLQQHRYKLCEDRWKLQRKTGGIGVHFLSGLIWVGLSAKF